MSATLTHYTGGTAMPVTAALCWPDQHEADYLHDPAYWHARGMVLSVVGWVDGSPVATFAAFRGWLMAHATDDHNGNWGDVVQVMTSDAGLVMVHVDGDTLAAHDCTIGEYFGPDASDPANVWTLDGLLHSRSVGLVGSVWTPGDGGAYRIADADGWDEWSPITSLSDVLAAHPVRATR